LQQIEAVGAVSGVPPIASEFVPGKTDQGPQPDAVADPMPATRKIIGLLALSISLEAASTAGFAFSKHTVAAADVSVRRLLRLMDKDTNGIVSKDGFFQFMRQRFDRRNINRNGRLEPNELRPMNIPNWIISGSANAALQVACVARARNVPPAESTLSSSGISPGEVCVSSASRA